MTVDAGLGKRARCLPVVERAGGPRRVELYIHREWYKYYEVGKTKEGKGKKKRVWINTNHATHGRENRASLERRGRKRVNED